MLELFFCNLIEAASLPPAGGPPPAGFEDVQGIVWPGTDIRAINPGHVIEHMRNVLRLGLSRFDRNVSIKWLKMYKALLAAGEQSRNPSVIQHVRLLGAAEAQVPGFDWGVFNRRSILSDEMLGTNPATFERLLEDDRLFAFINLHFENAFGRRAGLLYTDDGMRISEEQSKNWLNEVYGFLEHQQRGEDGKARRILEAPEFNWGLVRVRREAPTPVEPARHFDFPSPDEGMVRPSHFGERVLPPAEGWGIVEIPGLGRTWDPERPGNQYTEKEWNYAGSALRFDRDEVLGFFGRLRGSTMLADIAEDAEPNPVNLEAPPPSAEVPSAPLSADERRRQQQEEEEASLALARRLQYEEGLSPEEREERLRADEALARQLAEEEGWY